VIGVADEEDASVTVADVAAKSVGVETAGPGSAVGGVTVVLEN
jgi:hypothetical protein